MFHHSPQCIILLFAAAQKTEEDDNIKKWNIQMKRLQEIRPDPNHPTKPINLMHTLLLLSLRAADLMHNLFECYSMYIVHCTL